MGKIEQSKKLWKIAKKKYNVELEKSGFKKYIAGVKILFNNEIIRIDEKTGEPIYFVLYVEFKIKGIEPDDIYVPGEVIYCDGIVEAGFEMPYNISGLYIWIDAGKYGLKQFEKELKKYEASTIAIRAPIIPKKSVAYGKQTVIKDFVAKSKSTEPVKLVNTEQLILDDFGFKPPLRKKKYKRKYTGYYNSWSAAGWDTPYERIKRKK